MQEEKPVVDADPVDVIAIGRDPVALELGIARNMVAAEWRRHAGELDKARRAGGHRHLDGDDILRLEEQIDAQRVARGLHATLSVLPERLRGVIELVDLDGLPLAEAAAVLGVREGTARVRLHRARKRLKAEFPSVQAAPAWSTARSTVPLAKGASLMSGISTDDAPLAGYQERRLAELTAAVAARAERGARAPAVQRSRRPGAAHRRSVWAVAAVASAASAAVVAMLAWTGSAQPAYAVTRDPSGLVTVRVGQKTLDSRDADALSRELRSLDVPAVVYSVPEYTVCPQPHARTVELPPNVYSMPDGLYTVPSDLPRPGGGWKMTINPGHFKPGQFMVWTLSTSGVYEQDGRRTGTATSVGTYLVSGRVIPCRYRPAPPVPAPKAAGEDGPMSVTDTGGRVSFADSP
ncbi:RNA polymerase sigma factor [Actinomadura roseirufa]|uniref:RNA polymerase sigma factor n=1 Tax=Actinomadura roseirufa TaxID=2094049 RepID=UPI001A955AAE|nr:sigma-70 family RNA polymerase sigma factor [Actinomadura roseirufa]